MNPDDVRPVLQSFEGKHIPIEWARREKEMADRHRAEWEAEQAAKPVKRNLGSLFGGGAASKEQGPPPTYLEQMRKQVRTAFATEHAAMRQQQDELMKKEIEEQKQKMKEMKMTVWDLMTQVSSVSRTGGSESWTCCISHITQGQPVLPPPGQQPSEQQQ